ncbi:MAG: hypothetical protein AB7O37_14170 [Vicinamibacteria bacterium]
MRLSGITGLRLAAALLVLAWSSPPIEAQTIRDGLMMSKGSLCTGFVYSHDSWDTYWEGALERDNENIGTLTTQSVAWVGNYGITDRLNVIAMAPYVWTGASQGVLRGLDGLQDLTVGLKYKALDTAFTQTGSLRAFAVVSAGTALSDYTPDFLPMSIGSQSDRISGRLTLDFWADRGWFVTGGAAYTWRDNVTLDRPSYFTDGRLYFSDQVEMPDVFDYTISAGYRKKGLQIPISFSQQITRGGGDIRRQDMPFVSNKMNYSQLSALVEWYLPPIERLAIQVSGAYTFDGRNVGQSTVLTAGFLYVFSF